MRFVLSVDNDNEFRSRCEWSHENPYFGVSKLAISSKSMRIFFILGRKRSILFRCASTGLGAKNLAAVMLAHADVCACVCVVINHFPMFARYKTTHFGQNATFMKSGRTDQHRYLLGYCSLCASPPDVPLISTSHIKTHLSATFGKVFQSVGPVISLLLGSVPPKM